MIHVYKSGGPYKTKSGAKYTIDAIERTDLPKYLADGWVLTEAEVKPKTKATKESKTEP